MIRHDLKAAILPALLLAIASSYAAPAAAASLDFCTAAANCIQGNVKNTSAVLVTKVVVDQLNRDGCTAVTKTHSRNMPSGSTGFRLNLLRKCTYVVRYKTTAGCTGNKDTTITPADIKTFKTYARLRGPCGGLSVKLAKDGTYSIQAPTK